MIYFRYGNIEVEITGKNLLELIEKFGTSGKIKTSQIIQFCDKKRLWKNV